MFHVGSLLRLVRVSLLRDKTTTSTALQRVELGFSELPPSSLKAANVEVALKQGSSWATVGLSSVSIPNLVLAQSIDLKTPIRIKVDHPDIDGAWTGVAGSGPAIAEFVPEQHTRDVGQVEFLVEPSLSIELPSGVKKP